MKSEEASVSCLEMGTIKGTLIKMGYKCLMWKKRMTTARSSSIFWVYIIFLFSLEEIQSNRWMEEKAENVSKNKVKVITAWLNLKSQKVCQNSRYLRLTARNNFILNTCAFLMILLAWWLCSPPSAGSADLLNFIKLVRKVNLSPELKGPLLQSKFDIGQ